MRKAFSALAILLMSVVVAEFFFAASGAFSTGPGGEAYRPHHVLGYVIFLLPVVMMIIGAAARLPRRLIGMAALVAGLTGVQVVIAKLARALGDPAGPLIFGLHAVNGIVMVAVVAMIVRQARALSKPVAAQVVVEA